MAKWTAETQRWHGRLPAGWHLPSLPPVQLPVDVVPPLPAPPSEHVHQHAAVVEPTTAVGLWVA
jgi:hypothetical protein